MGCSPATVPHMYVRANKRDVYLQQHAGCMQENARIQQTNLRRLYLFICVAIKKITKRRTGNLYFRVPRNTTEHVPFRYDQLLGTNPQMSCRSKLLLIKVTSAIYPYIVRS